jgi:hypothetical protein
MHLGSEILGDGSDDGYAGILGGASTTTPVPHLLTERIGQGAKLFTVHAVHLHRKNLHTFHDARGLLQAAQLRLGELVLQLLNLFFLSLLLEIQAFDLFGLRVIDLLQALHDRGSGDGFDPAHTGRDTAFVNTLHNPIWPVLAT